MNPSAWVWATPPPDALVRLAAELDAGRLPPDRQVLKENRLRTVWAVPGVAGGVLLKRYRRRPGEVLKTAVLGGRAEREYRAMESLVRVGLPTPRPWAHALREDQGEPVEWLLGRLVPRARTLAEALEQAMADGAPARAEQLVDAALEVVARLHDHPLLHRDLHAGNLLVGPDDRPQIIDLHSLWHVRRLRDAHRWHNLARLFASLRVLVDADDLPRWCARYAAARGEAPERVVAEVTRASAAFHADYVRGRTARCLVRSSEFVPERHARGRLLRRRRYEREQLDADLAAHQDAVRRGDLLGDAAAAQVSLVGTDGAAPRVVKHFRRRGPGRALRQALGRGRARSAWVAARRCELEGLPTPAGLALLEHADGSAVLVCEARPGAPTLRDHVAAHGLDADLATALGHVLGRLSRAGLRHDDLSAKNLLVCPGPPWQPRDLRLRPDPRWPDIQLIDLDNMTVTDRHDPAALERMLGQLADLPVEPSRTDRQHFARGFRRGAGRDVPPDVATAAQARAAARRARRERRVEAAARDAG